MSTLAAMATWEDVQALALALPETAERLSRGNRQWTVKEKNFVWERPLRQTDLAALGGLGQREREGLDVVPGRHGRERTHADGR